MFCLLRYIKAEPEARKRLAGGEGRGATGNHRKRTAHHSRYGMRPGRGARSVRMSPGDVSRQTLRALLAPFQGAGRFRVVGRADPVVAPPANFLRASGTESGATPNGGGRLLSCLRHDLGYNAMPRNSSLRVATRSEILPHGLNASLVALPSRVQHEKPGTLALSDASATRSRIHRRHHSKHGRRGSCGGRDGRSSPHRRRSAGDALSGGRDAGGEERVLTLDSRGTAAGGLCVAGGVWGLHLFRARFGGRAGLCAESGGASSREDVSGRIRGDAETRHGGV